MEEQAKQLQAEINEAAGRLKIPELQQRLSELQSQSQQSDFWDDSTHAQEVMKQISKLESRISPWITLQTRINEASEMAKRLV
jgi:hypothetical protein